MMAAFLPTLLLSTPASGADAGTGTGIGYTLEGCRASANAYTAPGTYVCPDANYTTGNLGKGWNEFDLVPGRVTLSAGTSAPPTQSYQFVIAVDNCSGGDGATGCKAAGDFPGYDQLSSDSGGAPTLNANLSSASGCGAIAASAPMYAPPTGSAIGGTGSSLYRVISITGQQSASTCVYDFYARLAFNSHLYPGSSLHYDLANASLGTSGIGAKDVSLPVSAILPPGFSKTQTSTQGSGVVWSVAKTATPASFSFPNTCSTATSEPTTQPVSINVSWTKRTTASGAITVDAHLSLQNNAHRQIDVSVSDQLYNGSSPTAGNENTNSTPGSPIVTAGGALNLAAGASYSFDDIWSVPSGTASAFSDKAAATFTDPTFNDTLGTATTTASSAVQTLVATSGSTATVQDVEAMTGSSDFNFTVDSVSPNLGSFEGGYSLGTATTGPVTWDSPVLSDSGSVTFNKTVYVLEATAGSATLGDTATLTPDGQSSVSDSAQTTINGNASVSIVISKTMSEAFSTGKTFTFNATGADSSTGSTTITVPAGSEGPVTGTISGLNPGVSYSLDEPAVAPFAEQTITGVQVNLPSCSTTKSVANAAAPASAQVQKLTNPAGSTAWTFSLTGVEPNGTTPVSDLSGGGSEVLSNVVANSGYAGFTSNLDQDGATYTITETKVTNWDLTSVSGDVAGVASRVAPSVSTATCSFTLNLTSDSGHVLECTFTNTERSDVTVVKTQNGAVPTLGYSFELSNAGNTTPAFDRTLTTNGTNLGTLNFGYLAPGSYTLCELAVPAGTHSTLQDQGGTLNATAGSVCLTFTLAAGSNQTFTIDNSYPLGNALTIGYWKHWNTYTLGSGAGAIAAKTGNALMNQFLPQYLGTYGVFTAQQGVNVLTNSSSKYAENGLAAQLLAGELNKAAGAATCPAETNAVAHANSLLTAIHYTGPPSSKIGSSSPQRADFISTAAALNSYNNNQLC
jgi:hypothetical protein